MNWEQLIVKNSDQNTASTAKKKERRKFQWVRLYNYTIDVHDLLFITITGYYIYCQHITYTVHIFADPKNNYTRNKSFIIRKNNFSRNIQKCSLVRSNLVNLLGLIHLVRT